ncbi:uncharacterized protein tmem176l.3a isoform X2 [Labeo rohita]|uniref:uncharacterized protein tmem176l.3a isoform X2 n=1 Tax=Labeo rohita TaxID=84645 RepID=UPI0021E309F1|nr:uncharacterized protein tmem176l.3a isoform X2 [Labeo rohita]
MPLTMSQSEGMMVVTITSNPKSKWPALCQILSSLCYGPVCFASEDMKEKLTDTQRVIGMIQIVVAVMNLVLGCFGIIYFLATSSVSSLVFSVLQICVVVSFCVLTLKSLCKKGTGGNTKLVEKTTLETKSGISHNTKDSMTDSMTPALSQNMKDVLTDTRTELLTLQIMVGVMNIAMGFFGFVFAFWIGSVFLVVGIICAVAVHFPHPKLLVIRVILNVVSAALAITAAVLYSVDLAVGSSLSCYREPYYYSSDNEFIRLNRKSSNFESCFYYKNLSEIILGGLDIMMIVLSVVQLCVTITFCVLTGKALCKKDEDEKLDPELYKPLLEDDTAGAA